LSKTIPVLSLFYRRGWFFDRMKESEEDKSSSFPFATAREVDGVEKKVI